MSFALWAIAYLIHSGSFLVTDVNIQLALARMVSMTKTLGLLLQMYAVSYSSGWCEKYDTPNCTHCRVCVRKVKRASVISTMAIIVILSQIFVSNVIYASSMAGIIDMNVIGDIYSDIYYAIADAGLCLYMAFKLLKFKQAKIYLFLAYMLKVLSICIKVANILLYRYNNNILDQIEWGISVAFIIIMVSEVHILIKE